MRTEKQSLRGNSRAKEVTVRHRRVTRSIDRNLNAGELGRTIGGIHRRLNRSLNELGQPLAQALDTIAEKGADNNDAADLLRGVATGLLGTKEDTK